MKNSLLLLFMIAISLSSCNLNDSTVESKLKGKHIYSGGTTKVKVGTWSTETVGNGAIMIDIDAGKFNMTAGSANTKTDLAIIFEQNFSNNVPEMYSFENMLTTAWGDYWRETSSNIYIYSQQWGTGQYGTLQITTLTEDLIEGEYEFKGTDTTEDFKERTVSGSFSIPKQ